MKLHITFPEFKIEYDSESEAGRGVQQLYQYDVKQNTNTNILLETAIIDAAGRLYNEIKGKPEVLATGTMAMQVEK